MMRVDMRGSHIAGKHLENVHTETLPANAENSKQS